MASLIEELIEVLGKECEIYENLYEVSTKKTEVIVKADDLVTGVQTCALPISNVWNRELLENALEMTEFNINILQTAGQAPETANYDKNSYSGDLLGVATSQFDSKS